MYVVLEYLICVLLLLLCSGLLFAVWVALLLVQERAKVMGRVGRDIARGLVRQKDRAIFMLVNHRPVLWLLSTGSFKRVRNAD